MRKIYEQIAELVREIQDYPLNIDTVAAYKKKFLERSGCIQPLFTQLTRLSVKERAPIGHKLNELKKLAERRYEHVKLAVEQDKKSKQGDITLPPPPMMRGSLHLLTQVEKRVIDILERIGFQVAVGPEIEDEWHNFSALNFPKHHPARDMQDTFFITNRFDEKMFLRTQTSSVQVRVMERKLLPIRVISVGRVFRKETISTRSHCIFHQVEGLYVDKGVSFVDLKETLTYFVRSLFGDGVAMRLRPSFFPFTEPSAEMDIACLLCKGRGCSVCKRSGWVEIGGAGMVDPNVFEQCGISADVYTGFAFGIGIERIAMLLTEIPDIRVFFENDMRFLRQFSGSMLV